jgi:23S rRNA (uracil1939-C5)-methyltransferase
MFWAEGRWRSQSHRPDGATEQRRRAKAMAQQLTLFLSDMAYGGEAVGRFEGKAVFVPYAVPGETARVQVVTDKGRFARARLLEILTPSPRRVAPPCPQFGVCGGCQWQHVEYQAQLEYKHSIVLSQLQHIAARPDAPVRPTLGMDNPWCYRNHVQFGVSNGSQLGFMATGSHRVVPIERCLLMHALLDELYTSLNIELLGLRRLTLRAGVNTGERMIILEMEEDQPPEVEVDLPVSFVMLLSDGTPVTLLGSSHIHERLAGRMYRVSAPSFFQVNTQQAEMVVSTVHSYLNATADDTILDAYCGVGTFALELARTARQVVGIESSAPALADAVANAVGVDNVRFVHGPVAENLNTLDLARRGATEYLKAPLAVLDPPREGVGQEVVAALARLAVQRIVYVSCDPATLARDIKGMLAAGYTLREVQPIDMFPQTYHIESVALLERR